MSDESRSAPGDDRRPPDGDDLTPLLLERWPIADDESLRVRVDGDQRRIDLALRGPRHRYSLSLTLKAAPPEADPWPLLVDALDALFGQLIESGRDHRSLPAGVGVTFQGAEFDVIVEHAVPELEKLADQLLAEDDDVN